MQQYVYPAAEEKPWRITYHVIFVRELVKIVREGVKIVREIVGVMICCTPRFFHSCYPVSTFLCHGTRTKQP